MPETNTPKLVEYIVVPSPIGKLLLAAQDGQIIHVAFENHDFSVVLKNLETQFGVPIEQDNQVLQAASRQLDEYFAGARKVFQLPIRKPAAPGFLATVQQQLQTIPYGETCTYGEFATALGNPGAARAVGTACARNPLPLFQPCHRVVRADGSIGQFSGTPGAKQFLLALERGEYPEPPTA